MIEDEDDRFAKVFKALFAGLALAVGAGDFGAVGDIPGRVPFDDGGELVAHVCSLAPHVGGRFPASAVRTCGLEFQELALGYG